MDVFEMKFSKVFPLLIAKAVRKGRTEMEVFAVTEWLTGYSEEELRALLSSERSKIRACATSGSWTNSSTTSPKENPSTKSCRRGKP